MYREDSFFTLTAAGQAGLVLVTLALSAGLLAAVCFAARSRPIWARSGLALLAFYLFVWLSPQLFYTYYLTIIDGLPPQLVISAPPTAPDIARLLSFSGRFDLAAHGQGGLGWLTLIVAAAAPRLARFLRRCRGAAN